MSLCSDSQNTPSAWATGSHTRPRRSLKRAWSAEIRHRSHPGLEQVAPRTHLVGSRPRAPAPRPTPPCRRWAGPGPGTSTPTTSASTTWTGFFDCSRLLHPRCGRFHRQAGATPPMSSAFVDRHPELLGTLEIPGIDAPFHTAPSRVEPHRRASTCPPCRRPGRIYRHIAEQRAEATFITEVSMDETDVPADARRAAVHPRRAGRRRHPGADHRAEVHRPLQQGRGLCRRRRRSSSASSTTTSPSSPSPSSAYGLPREPQAQRPLRQRQVLDLPGPSAAPCETHGAGVHLKTAGTTWLEELIGLAEAGGDGLAIAKEVYAEAFGHSEELCAPYATVIDIDPRNCPTRRRLAAGTASSSPRALRHDQACPALQPPPAPVAPRRLQGRREDGRPLHGDARRSRRVGLTQRQGEPLGTPHSPGLPRRLTSKRFVWRRAREGLRGPGKTKSDSGRPSGRPYCFAGAVPRFS